MQKVETPNAPPALGHYEQAWIHNGLVFTSGQIPLDPSNPAEVTGDITSQVKQTLQNVEAILIAAGSDKYHVLKVTIFMANIQDWPIINQVYADFFESHKPARSAVPVPALPKGSLVEIEVIASVKSSSPS
jgi:2-iminobutanoate/2-iminopropanoate deaminase